ncbi:MAG: zinc metallopeptidase [Tissierellia bacterium]|nr:zinc metallopeptidase [Tissierellia bacterium]
MKWKGRRSSSNVEKRGSASSGSGGFSGGGFGGGGRRTGGGGGGFPIPMGGGIGTIILLIIVMLLFGNPFGGGNAPTQPGNVPQENSAQQDLSAEEAELQEFLSVVLADTEDYWNQIFQDNNMEYREPTLVLYQDTVRSGCGAARSNMGPFYCPADEGVYIDVTFYHDLKNNYGAEGGEFAMAYVLAHEVGHHVQKLLGVTDEVFALQKRLPEKEFNKYMVRMELQADYYAGVFAHYTQRSGYLEEGDFEEALSAASAVGDDRIQEQAWGQVVPDKFTHGTSEQRMNWFKRGFQYGTLQDGDTFNAPSI